MTRVTNIGRKRSYVEASFKYNEEDSPEDPPQLTLQLDDSLEEEKPPKKKRKRGKKPKRDALVNGEDDQPVESGKQDGNTNSAIKKSKKAKFRSIKDRKLASEQRRLSRIAERNADKICFACREKGHAVQDCPRIADGSIKALDKGVHGKNDAGVVGICYRCGSRRHRLSQCRERIDPEEPLPFASCFVCAGTGHLSSSCPQNKAKGVYPNGGCCKLCQETDHLARDCKLRNKSVTSNTLFVGMGKAAGPDEDDFHTFSRSTREVEKEAKEVDKVLKAKSVQVGVHSGQPAAVGVKSKKIVNF